jgi:hypothetical protein
MKIEIKSFVILIIILTLIIMGSKLFVNENSVEHLIVNPLQQKKSDQLYSDKKLGSFVIEGKTFFRVFSPSAEDLKLIIF